MTTVLCTNGLLSKTLAVVRSLGSRNIRVIVAEKNRFHPGGMSKYCAKSVLSPDPVIEPQRYLKWLISTVQEEKCDIVYFMDDDTMSIASANREELSKYCTFVIPPAQSYLIASDKEETIKKAISIGIPCPQTVATSSKVKLEKSQLLDLVQGFSFPLVIKPRISNGSRGIRFINYRDSLWETYQEVHKQYPYPVIQEYIPPGTKYDVCVCYDDNHELKASFVQRQIRNYPIHKGPSTIHESENYPLLISLSKKLLDEISWKGVADVEFMIDPRDGQPKLMEINPRFWSSVHLSIHSGIDFPYLLYQIALGETISSVVDFVEGKRGRSLLPGDLLHFLFNPNRWKVDPPFWTTQIPDDTISLKDPLPTLGFVLSALHYSFDSKVWKFVVRR